LFYKEKEVWTMLHRNGRGILIDFDDTLVETTVFFEMAREKFARFMVDIGFPLAEVLETLNQKDIENVDRCGGFLKECFPRAMVETYQHFCSISGLAADPGVSREVEEIGWWVFGQDPAPVPGACEVLEELAGNYRLFLATKGDPSVQWPRIVKSGIKKFFSDVYVLKDKTRHEYEKIARLNGLDTGCSWVVGNSIKSDINPGIMAGFKCIFIPNRYTWHYEMEEPAGDFVTLESIGMVPELVLKDSFLCEIV
jgi:putative hydrolase of the HAD superfamily